MNQDEMIRRIPTDKLAAIVNLVVGLITIASALIAVVRYFGRLDPRMLIVGPLVACVIAILWKALKQNSWRVTIILILILVLCDGFIIYDWISSGKKLNPATRSFSVDAHYVASGIMGDLGDVSSGGQRFTYSPNSRGPHEWEWKWIGGKPNQNPCKFAGVVWLSPPNEFGTVPDCGYDLRGFKWIQWEARCIGNPIKLKFFIGGINWVWKQARDGSWHKDSAPYPDSMPARNLGTYTLSCNDWQSFIVSLSDEPTQNFKRIVGGFGWCASWEDNGLNIPEDDRKFTFEVRNIRYLRDIPE